MDLKLTNNNLLSLGSTIGSGITTNCTTVFVKNCPNVSGITILRQCPNLTRVRLDIGSVLGSLDELLQYSTLNGFNDNYEPQAKPRLVGTWTINSWYTQEQLSMAQNSFDGLTIQGDGTHLINFSNLAVQTLDSTQPNYNPAAAIILEGQSKGVTLNNPIVSGGGRWFLSKIDASEITDISNWFYNKSALTDTNNICGNGVSQTYFFTSFNEFQYFGVTSIGTPNNNTRAFCSCILLEEIILPSTLATVNNIFNGCTALRSVTIKSNSWQFGASSNNHFTGCSSLESIDLSTLSSTIIPTNCFSGCAKLKNIVLPQSITTISGNAFRDVGSNATFTEDDEWDLYLPNLTTLSSEGGFNNCKTLTNISSLGSITTIPYRYWFNGCTRLKTVVLPNTIQSLYNQAFYGCTNLESINLPSSLTELVGSPFGECSKLKLTSIPSSLITINSKVFQSVGSSITFQPNELLDVNLPNLTILSGEANFLSCTWIKTLKFGQITEFPYRNQIQKCSNLQLLELPSTLTTIGAGAFTNQDPQNLILHILATTPPTIPLNQHLPTHIYVGDATSSLHDNAVLAAYLADTNWATYSSILDTWYNYLHPTT